MIKEFKKWVFKDKAERRFFMKVKRGHFNANAATTHHGR